jgi:hypothetical protein
MYIEKHKQRSKGNWSSRASRFVSQVHQPAWAEPHILPDPRPKEAHPRVIARELDEKADLFLDSDKELKLRLGKMKVI